MHREERTAVAAERREPLDGDKYQKFQRQPVDERQGERGEVLVEE